MATYPRNGWVLMTAMVDGVPVDLQPEAFDDREPSDVPGEGGHWGLPVRSPNGKEIKSWFPPASEVPRPRVLSKFEFLNLFGPEKIAAAIALKATTLAVFWVYYEAASTFERDHPTTQAGLDQLESAGVLSGEEKSDVVANWPTA